MYTDDTTLEECTQLWQNCYDLSQVFLEDAPVKTSDLILPSESTVECNTTKSLYVIKQGILKESYHNNVIINYEPGDLVGADTLLQSKPTKITTDFAITVDEYDGLQLLEYIRADDTRHQAWTQYLMNLIQSYQILMCHHKKQEQQFHPVIRHFDKGATIIQQGSKDNDVFTLMSGSAQVLVGETVVGEIKRDEVFGAIAALTDTPRTATVKAESQCSVLVVPSTQFKELLSSRPDTMAKLVEDMARTIISSNEKIVSLSKA
ncbi:MAG: cyclic nucleotide-binding domain-containing protein [Gammaproteobacteria bacterium]|nr:cyclic nucleotide-binding domain-containing protein [Gammaproteobacteria bacterium]